MCYSCLVTTRKTIHRFMRTGLALLSAAFFCLAPSESYSQFAPAAGASGALANPPSGPRFGGALSKLFGENNAFTARMEMEIKEPGSPEVITMPGRISFLEGKTRFEMDITEAKGTKMPQSAAAQVKALGMGEVVMISIPEKKLAYVVYPGMQAYVESALDDDEAAAPDAKYKVETTELGEGTVNGQSCVKNKVIVTDEKGTPHQATVWNATVLKNFPLKIQYAEAGRDSTMTFREVKLVKPNAVLFDPPATFTRYESLAAMLRGIMLKQFGGGSLPKKE